MSAAPDCFERGLRLLSLRPHFRTELERKLRQRGYEEDDVSAALDRLTALGHLDDDKTSQSFVETRRRRPEGNRRTRAELRRRGAPAASIDKVLAGPHDEGAAALAAAQRWLARRPLREEKDHAALARHLDRRGFTAAVISATLRECAGRSRS